MLGYGFCWGPESATQTWTQTPEKPGTKPGRSGIPMAITTHTHQGNALGSFFGTQKEGERKGEADGLMKPESIRYCINLAKASLYCLGQEYKWTIIFLFLSLRHI